MNALAWICIGLMGLFLLVCYGMFYVLSFVERQYYSDKFKFYCWTGGIVTTCGAYIWWLI